MSKHQDTAAKKRRCPICKARTVRNLCFPHTCTACGWDSEHEEYQTEIGPMDAASFKMGEKAG